MIYKHYPDDYIWIARWGDFQHSFAFYVREQQILAAQQAAPLTAIYKRASGEWATIEKVTNPETLLYFRNRYPEVSYEVSD